MGGEPSWGSVFCAETPLGYHLHPVRMAVDGGSKQETSGVFGSWVRRLPAYTRGQEGHRVHRTSGVVCCTVSNVAPAPTGYAAPVHVTPALVVE